MVGLACFSHIIVFAVSGTGRSHSHNFFHQVNRRANVLKFIKGISKCKFLSSASTVCTAPGLNFDMV